MKNVINVRLVASAILALLAEVALVTTSGTGTELKKSDIHVSSQGS